MDVDDIHRKISDNRLLPIQRKTEQYFCLPQLLTFKEETNKFVQNTQCEFDEQNEVQKHNITVDKTDMGRYLVEKIVNGIFAN